MNELLMIVALSALIGYKEKDQSNNNVGLGRSKTGGN